MDVQTEECESESYEDDEEYDDDMDDETVSHLSYLTF